MFWPRSFFLNATPPTFQFEYLLRFLKGPVSLFRPLLRAGWKKGSFE